MSVVLADIVTGRYEDGTFVVELNNPTPIGGWTIDFLVQKRFGGLSGLIHKQVASGFNGASGITITNSGQGVFQIALNSVDTSGLDYGNYAYATQRLDSGSRTLINEGYISILPGVG